MLLRQIATGNNGHLQFSSELMVIYLFGDFTSSNRKSPNLGFDKNFPNESQDQQFFDAVTEMIQTAQDEIIQLAKIMKDNPGKYTSLNDIWQLRDKNYWD